MKKCLTKPLLTGFSGCLVEKPACKFAVPLGFSYLCEHPQHSDFHPSSDQTVHHDLLYKDLRNSRRKDYLSTAEKLISEIGPEQTDPSGVLKRFVTLFSHSDEH